MGRVLRVNDGTSIGRTGSTATRISIGLVVTIFCLTALTSCAVPFSHHRPSDSKLKAAINFLLSDFQNNHPNLITWKKGSVQKQLSEPLPQGFSTEAGWLLGWPHASANELSQVVLPWNLLGMTPKNVHSYFAHYPEQGSISSAQIAAITGTVVNDEMNGDKYFGSVTDISESKIDPQWFVFTTVPYLPVTDPAYGFATLASNHWKVVDFGTALVGCGTVPLKVEAEFGFQCPTN